MLKLFSFSLTLAVALGASSLSFAGHGNSGCTTCGLASPQGSVVSPQSIVASPQSYDSGCDTCAPKKKCFLSGMKLPKLSLPKHTYTYEWVLKKKKVKGHGGGCGDTGCNECASAAPAVYPTSQVAPSGQGYAAPAYAAPQAYGAPQHAAPQAAGQSAMLSAPGEMKPALAADEVPPAPTIANGSRMLQLSPSGN